MDKITVDYLQKKLDEITSLEKNKSELLSKWISLIITILVGLLSVLVTFGTNKNNDCFNQYLFSFILISLACGIISGVYYLYHQIDETIQEIKIQRNNFEIRITTGDINSTLQNTIPENRYFKIGKNIFLIASGLTILLLVIYGIRIN